MQEDKTHDPLQFPHGDHDGQKHERGRQGRRLTASSSEAQYVDTSDDKARDPRQDDAARDRFDAKQIAASNGFTKRLKHGPSPDWLIAPPDQRTVGTWKRIGERVDTPRQLS